MNTIDTLPISLTYLDCSSNKLSNLPSLPNNLVYLGCEHNFLYSLPDLPPTLVTLVCNDNSLYSLPSLPNGLEDIESERNQINNLPVLNQALLSLECGHNQISNIDTLPPTLISFRCEYNYLTTLPELPITLTDFDCSGNFLNQLQPLPPYLEDLYCSSNQLTFLPDLPFTLYALDCGNNLIDSLPDISRVTRLWCSHNKLNSLPILSADIQELDCGNNNLTSIPILPSLMSELFVDSNFSLKCLPPIKEIYFTGDIDISGTSIHCLPNHIIHSIYHDFKKIDTLPLCDLTNFNGCPVAWNIEGGIFYDKDGNCNTTVGESALGEIKVEIDSNGNELEQYYTDSTGIFTFNVLQGSYTIKVDTTEMPFTVLCPNSSYHSTTINTSTPTDSAVNFRLVCKPGYDLGVFSIYYGGQFFPGRNASLSIAAGDLALFYGVNCNTSGLGGTVKTIITGPVRISGTSNGGTVIGDTITWNVPDFSAVNFNSDFYVNLQTNTAAQSGDQVCVIATISATAGTDNNSSNNTLTQCFTVSNSHDPNYKEVYPANVSPDGWLTYTIHFQNTGTAAAQNIQVRDTFDTNLDPETFQLLSYSKQPLVQITGRYAVFSFPNINLVDSTSNADSSIGFVQYRIKPKQNLPLNSTISNRASIYFDYNPPVVTNIATSVIAPNKIAGATESLKAVPNPTDGILNIVLPKPCDDCRIQIMNDMGQIVATLTTEKDNIAKLDMSQFARGIYFIQLRTETATEVTRIIKQ